jgi:hypothetical protein
MSSWKHSTPGVVAQGTQLDMPLSGTMSPDLRHSIYGPNSTAPQPGGSASSACLRESNRLLEPTNRFPDELTTEPWELSTFSMPPGAHIYLGLLPRASRARSHARRGQQSKIKPRPGPRTGQAAGRVVGWHGGARYGVKTRSWALVMVGDSIYTYQYSVSLSLVAGLPSVGSSCKCHGHAMVHGGAQAQAQVAPCARCTQFGSENEDAGLELSPSMDIRLAHNHSRAQLVHLAAAMTNHQPHQHRSSTSSCVPPPPQTDTEKQKPKTTLRALETPPTITHIYIISCFA